MSLIREAASTSVELARGCADIERILPALDSHWKAQDTVTLSQHPAWALVLARSMGHTPYVLTTNDDDDRHVTGQLPLVLLDTPLFGRFLIGLAYVNYGGPLADSPDAAHQLIDAATQLADQLRVKFLELRTSARIDHPRLSAHPASKVHMRLPLPTHVDLLWKSLDPKVRNQIRKAEKAGLTAEWGRHESVAPFYDVFCRNMRDLGTPVFPKRLFVEALSQFPERAELCVVRQGSKPIAGAFLTHGRRITEVPSASSLREYNSTCANMFMYWKLLERTIELGHSWFDFGRSTPDGPVYRFKKQWGAQPLPAEWQIYGRSGSGGEMRPDNPRYSRAIELWKKLPVPVTRYIGPLIVRGIP